VSSRLGIAAGARTSIEELRRSELVEATVRTIAERGFHRTTVRDIARAAETSPASVLYYFSTKDELLAVAFAESDQRFRARVRAEVGELSGAAQIARIVELCFPDDPSGDPEWNLEIDLWALAARREDFREMFEAASADWLDIIVSALTAGVERGELHLGGDIRDDAMALAALIDGLAVHTRVTQHLDPGSARRIVMGQIDQMRSR
jgi:AcrR family transcriptional regulator